ncbi:unnamed protein product, partial [Musa acuminata subsp. burmannicoides]
SLSLVFTSPKGSVKAGWLEPTTSVFTSYGVYLHLLLQTPTTLFALYKRSQLFSCPTCIR